MQEENVLLKFNHAFMSYKDFLFNRKNIELHNNNNIKTLLILYSILKTIGLYNTPFPTFLYSKQHSKTLDSFSLFIPLLFS